MKTGHFESGIAQGSALTALLRDEPTQRGAATFHLHAGGQQSAGAQSQGGRLNRWNSGRCERAFAHVFEMGGGRRSWLRGLENVSKHLTLKCAAYSLGLLLRTA